MSRPALLASAALFAATTAVATAVSARHPDLPDEPLGLRFPGNVRVHLALGLGSGVAAPWPMPVAALVAAAMDAPSRVGPARTCAAIGATVLVGTLLEPTSWGLRPRSDAVRLTAALHLLCGSALFLAGTWSAPATT
jgi:hypothetical protein